MKPDTNLISYNGPDWSNRTEFRAGGGPIVAGPEFSDAVKITSRIENFTLHLAPVFGGKEDCVDINDHSFNVAVDSELWVPRGKYLATIKGGSSEIILTGKVRGHGSVVDVDIGNIADQSDDPTGPVYIALEHEDGDPITVRIINGCKVEFLNPTSQKYKVVLNLRQPFGSWFSKIYKFFKRVFK